jgi:hypothetical protein
MENPIKAATRAKIYLFGAIAGVVLTGIISVLVAYGLSVYVPLASIAAATITAVVGLLARANIDLPAEDLKKVVEANKVDSDLQFAKLSDEPRHRKDGSALDAS